MEFDMCKTCSTDSDVKFFEEHKFEVIAQCMRLEPNTDGMLESVRIDTRIKAMNAIAEKYEYGPFATVCNTCIRDPLICIANADEDMMFGWAKGNDNVCFCRQYEREKTDERKSTIETETTDPRQTSPGNERE